jgi:5-methyltetrahydropteroyltriglutamate--homocysteine methyltransferase
MKRSSERILTTHVGSLVRPIPVREVMAAREQELPFDEPAFETTLRNAVDEVVSRQAEAGVDIISDGEFGKTGWNRYVAERLGGLVHREVRPGELEHSNLNIISEVKKFPEFYAAYDAVQKFDWLPPGQSKALPRDHGERPPQRKMIWECVAPITYRGHAAIKRDIANFKAALGRAKVQEAFLPVAAPMSGRGQWINSHYPDEDSLVTAIAAAMKEEYRAIIDAGLLLQIDDPFLADQYARRLEVMGPEGAFKYCESRIELLNQALSGIPEDRIRYHVCWGSWNSPHTTDVPVRTLLPLIFKVRAQAYSIEAANPRHEHEWMVWKDVKLPDGKILIPGMVTHSTNVVEHPELVAWRIQNFTNLVGRENIIAGTDCGFSQSYNHLRVHASVQWAKLESLVEGAQIASKQLW